MILITGGAGFIGSHVALRLQELGHETVVLDDLSYGDRRAVLEGAFVQGDIGDASLLEQIFKDYPIAAVFHFAAYIDVGESVAHPEKYYKNNVEKTGVLLESVAKHGVENFIFSSTAAVYGNPHENKIAETHPTFPINPYGESKLLAEKLLADFKDIRSISLRYFNAAGGDPKKRLKNFKKKESNLIPAALHSLVNGGSLTIFGEDYATPDGTCIRDYIHVWDLAEAHILALHALQKGASSNVFNLGNGQGYSVKQVLKSVEDVTNKKLNIINGPRRPGDPPVLVADAAKAFHQFHWRPQFPALNSIVSDAWAGLCLP